MNPEITEALAVVCEMYTQSIFVDASNGDLHLGGKGYPDAELYQRWIDAKPTIIGLLGWALPLQMPEWDRENEYNETLTPFVDIDTAWSFWRPSN